MRPARFTRAPLALAAAVTVALATGFAPQALAQSANAAPAPINLPAMPLGQALNELARQANLQMTFPAALVAGKSAPAVSGPLTAKQALDRLLANSGLEAAVEGSAVTALLKDGFSGDWIERVAYIHHCDEASFGDLGANVTAELAVHCRPHLVVARPGEADAVDRSRWHQRR